MGESRTRSSMAVEGLELLCRAGAAVPGWKAMLVADFHGEDLGLGMWGCSFGAFWV